MSVLGLAIAATAIISFFSSIAIVGAFDGAIETTAWLILVVGYILGALLGAALATAGALAEVT